jgi:hypothetical protein
MAEPPHQPGVVDFADRIVIGLLGLLFLFGHGASGASVSIVRSGFQKERSGDSGQGRTVYRS